MNLIQKVGITSIFITGLVVLSLMPLIAAANGDRGERGDRELRPLRPLAQRVEVAITDSGNVLVRGAKVTGISGTTLTVTTTAGSSTLSWAVTTSSSTSFLTSAGSGSSLLQISVGDTVSFAGSLAGTGLSVKATAVKDWTVGASERMVSGSVRSVKSASSTITIGKGKDNDNDNKKTLTIQLTGSTVITLNGVTTTLSSIVVGDKVEATGFVNAGGTVLTATSVTVMHPPVALGTSELEKQIKQWFKNRGLGIFGSKKDD